MSMLSSESSDYFNYGPVYRPPSLRTKVPYSQTLAQPLIYYAQVQPSPNIQRRKDVNKNKPKSFMKAFRWYTQDHKSHSRELPGNQTHLEGFAQWLDLKYDEFLEQKRAKQDNFPIQPIQTIQWDANKTVNSVTLGSRTTNFLARIKSPWRKRRHKSSNGECGDISKCNQSLEFLLKPKELSHHISECQISSSETSKRTISRLRALSLETTSIESEPCDCDILEILKTEDCAKIITDSVEPQIKKTKLNKAKSKNSSKLVKAVSCECPTEKIVSFDAQTQCDGDIQCKSSKGPLLQPNKDRKEIYRGASQAHENKTRYKSSPITKLNEHKGGSRPNTIICQCSDRVIIKRNAENLKYQNFMDIECRCPLGSDLKSTKKTKKSPVPNVQCLCEKIIRNSQLSRDENTDMCLGNSCPKCNSVMTSIPRIDQSNIKSGPGTTQTSDHSIYHTKKSPVPNAQDSCEKIIKISQLSRDENTDISQGNSSPKRNSVMTSIPRIDQSNIKCGPGTTQTSDHSINLDTSRYPLFMKIIYADKLTEEVPRK